MNDELTYAIITPHSIAKSRVGGIMAQLLSRTGLDLAAAQVIAPTREFAEAYATVVENSKRNDDPTAAALLGEYIRREFTPYKNSHELAILLLLRGANACVKTYHAVGQLRQETLDGGTIRGTYAEYVLDRDGSMRYFEPAILAAPNHGCLVDHLKVIGDFVSTQPSLPDHQLLLRDTCQDRTLVIIKPDNWRSANMRAGNIIDMLGRTGLSLVGCKVYHMSVAEAIEFYGAVKEIMRTRLAPSIAAKARETLEKQFDVSLDANDEATLRDTVGAKCAANHFATLIKFMSGHRPDEPSAATPSPSDSAKSMVLIYQGQGCIEKIRGILGPTDPAKAPAGTVRHEFGTNIMVNAAHASDSPENARREMRIVGIEKNNTADIISKFVARHHA